MCYQPDYGNNVVFADNFARKSIFKLKKGKTWDRALWDARHKVISGEMEVSKCSNKGWVIQVGFKPLQNQIDPPSNLSSWWPQSVVLKAELWSRSTNKLMFFFFFF